MSMPTQSYVHGASSQPLIGSTIGALFDEVAARRADAEALVVIHQGIRWTYADLKRQVDAFAAGLLGLGLKPRDRLAVWSPNNAEWVVTMFAAAKTGIILVNFNPAYRLVELEYSLNKLGCKALVTASGFKVSNFIEMLRTLAPELDTCEPGRLHAAKVPELRTVIRIGDEETPGMYRFADIPGMASDGDQERLVSLAGELQFDDPINVQFTSGTTGRPKGATLTHHNLLNNSFFIGEFMRFTEQDRTCIPVPLYHCFGMCHGVLSTVTHGGTMVFPGEAFDPLAVLQTVESEKCTVLHGVPTMFIAELDHPDFKKYDVSSLRTGAMGGTPCPIEVMRRVVNEMHMDEVTITYGMTENSPITFQSSGDDPVERRVTSVGRIHPHVEAKVVDAQGRIVPVGEAGELLTRGYCVMLGYWDDPERTAEAIDEAGWMHTGDLAVIDEEGYCKIVGRLKDMVIRGGENIYPREIEEFLYLHPKVQEVQVVGVPDAKYGEELCAWIRLKDGVTADPQEIKEFCKGQISHYKIPRYIKFVDEFPMTVSGKVQKFVMRDRMVKELGLEEIETA
ncbi:MAG: AMP-binding protein [Desulfomonilaceae bacterium]|nr:AMP-binding protein [Desulfomonilaceae bacterium]